MINNRIVLIPVQSTQSRSASTTFLTTHLARGPHHKNVPAPCARRADNCGGRPSQLGSRTSMAQGGVRPHLSGGMLVQ
jgi:hypothetical protein